MKISNTLFERIKKFEGCKLAAYQDAAGVWTIGYGHTQGVKPGDRITQYQADEMLREDLATFEQYANRQRAIKTQGQFDAVVDFCYNCGIANYANSTLKKRIDAMARTADIQREFLRWTYSGGKQLDGLYSRRIWEAARWNETT